MQLAAAKNVAVNAGEDISIGAMGSATLLTSEKLGLFARTGQLRLSPASDISFVGKKRITPNRGGSYLRYESGKVE